MNINLLFYRLLIEIEAATPRESERALDPGDIRGTKTKTATSRGNAFETNFLLVSPESVRSNENQPLDAKKGMLPKPFMTFGTSLCFLFNLLFFNEDHFQIVAFLELGNRFKIGWQSKLFNNGIFTTRLFKRFINKPFKLFHTKRTTI